MASKLPCCANARHHTDNGGVVCVNCGRHRLQHVYESDLGDAVAMAGTAGHDLPGPPVPGGVGEHAGGPESPRTRSPLRAKGRSDGRTSPEIQRANVALLRRQFERATLRLLDDLCPQMDEEPARAATDDVLRSVHVFYPRLAALRKGSERDTSITTLVLLLLRHWFKTHGQHLPPGGDTVLEKTLAEVPIRREEDWVMRHIGDFTWAR